MVKTRAVAEMEEKCQQLFVLMQEMNKNIEEGQEEMKKCQKEKLEGVQYYKCD